MNKEIVCTESGLQISRPFALSLLHEWCPELRWPPEESIAAAEDAYYQEYAAPPDFTAMTKQSFKLPMRVTNFQDTSTGGVFDVLPRL